ncbi:MAG: S8 family serine peptidase [Lacibacter sp.]
MKNVCIALSLFFFSLNATAQKTAGTIRLKGENLVVKQNMTADEVNAELQKGKYGNSIYTMLVFEQRITAAQQKMIKSLGIEILYYLPDNTYQIRMKQVPMLSKFYEAGVKAVIHMPGSAKIGKELKTLLSTKTSELPVLINLKLHAGVKWNDVQSQLAFLGVTLKKADYLNQGLAQVSVAAGRISVISELPFVAYLNLSFLNIEPLNQKERGMFGLTNLTSLEVAGRHLTGSGVTIGIGDNADVSLHIDNANNTINRNPSYYTNGHGRLVGGTAAGNGIIEERYKGAAPGSLMISDYYDYILTKSATYFSDYNMLVTNNSYYNGLAGCIGNSSYNELSSYIDQQIFDNPYLQHIFAAGNDGTRTCSPFPLSFATIKSGYQVGKNVLDVADYHITNDNLNLSSSKGPVEDGRIKPEIAASGSAVISTGLLNIYNGGFGTSHSTPFVTGVWSLLTERYRQLHGNANPKSALLKAVICNSADDRGNAGPDYGYGFGLINPRRAVEMIEQNHYFTGTLSTGGNNSQNIAVPAGTRQVKIMLYWHDKEAAAYSFPALVNDLDLSVIDGVTTYLPWILNPAPGSVNVAATRGVDHINNIEQVTISNPGTTINIQLDGFDVPDGPVEYFVTYEFLMDEIKLEHPYGGERFSPGQEEIIKWNATDNSSNTFTLEISLDDGATWSLIDNNVAASQHRYRWTVPNTPANKGKIRVTRNGGGAAVTAPGNFTILTQPTLTATVPCEGYVDLNWASITSATDYEILQLVNGALSSIGTTATLNYRISGLDKTQTYWFTVRARMTDSLGMRATAKNITPSLGTPCSAAEFNNDLKLDTLIAPLNGRTNTSTQLSAAQQITVRIKNLDDVDTPGSYDISYQINGGSVITESSSASIAAGGTVNYTFTTTANLSATGTYTVRVFVKQTGDAQTANDEMTYTIRHVANPPVVLPFAETFETTGTAEYRSNLFALTNADRFDFTTANSNGRFRTFINSGVSITGTRSATLDAVNYNGTLSDNTLTATINLSSYAATPGLRFDFKFKNHGQLKQPGTGVWMRGSDASPWIQVYDLSANQGAMGEVKQPSIIINDLGQPITSSFQIRFDEQGLASANNGEYFQENPDMDDGFSFDDIRIVATTNDVMVTRLVAPDTFNCSPGNAAITIRLKNTTATTFNNVPVYYRLFNGIPVAGTVPVLNANSETDYTFTTLANLSTFRSYEIDAWVELAGDSYPVNDSVNNQFVYSSPAISTFPYLERFDTDNGTWFTDTVSYSSWSWGQPFKTLMNRSASADNGWFTSLYSTYKQNENSYLYSPCFNLSSLTQPVFSFSHISQQEANCNCDFHTLDYSIDNGNTWQRLTAVNGTNWFDSAANQSWNNNIQRWHVSSTEVPNAANIRFRFLLSSDELTQSEGVGIDDIHIFEKGTIYTGTNVSNINAAVSGSSWIDFMSGGNLVASINPLGQNLGSTDVSVYINTGAIRFNTNQYYLDRNIVIRPSIAPTDSVLVRFYFTEQEATAYIQATGCGTCTKVKDAFLVGVTKFSGTFANENGTLADNSGTYTFILPANVDVVPFNNGYYAQFKVRTFSEFWINGGGITADQSLPITLLNFTGIKRYPDADLQWQTSGESNGDYFEVERRIDNEAHFVTIGTVSAQASSSQTTTYKFTDNNVLKTGSHFYYRLKMVDKNGRTSYSNIIQLSLQTQDVFVKGVYNNAGNSLIIAAGNKAHVREINIRILNSLGQVMITQRFPYKDTRIDISKLAAGTYFIELKDQTGKEVFTQKLVKQ